MTAGIISRPGLRPFERPPQPTGPLLREGYVVPRLITTTSRSASLGDSCRLHRISAYTASPCPTTWSGLPPRPSPLWVSDPSIRAISPTPGGGSGAHFQSSPIPKAFPKTRAGRLLQNPDTGFCRVSFTTLQSSLHATARMVARPPVPVRPGISPGRRELLLLSLLK